MLETGITQPTQRFDNCFDITPVLPNSNNSFFFCGMRYTISNINHASHDLDEHIIHFNFDVNFIEPEPPVVVKYHHEYGELMHYLKTAHPDELDKYGNAKRSREY